MKRYCKVASGFMHDTESSEWIVAQSAIIQSLSARNRRKVSACKQRGYVKSCQGLLLCERDCLVCTKIVIRRLPGCLRTVYRMRETEYHLMSNYNLMVSPGNAELSELASR